MLKLARIYELMPVKQQKAMVELVTLAYNLTSSGFRTIPLITKIQAVTGLNINEIEIPLLSVYPSNDTPLNLLWILGFFLGDGNIYIRIRDKIVGLEYIPQLRFTQKNTVENLSLFTKMVDFISSLHGELSPLIKNQGANLVLILYGKTDLTNFMELLTPYYEFFFWKNLQFSILTRVLDFINLNIRNWLGLQKAILDIIYELPGERIYPYDHWINRLNEIFSVRFTDVDYFMSLKRVKSGVNKGTCTGWVVTLPKKLRIIPLQKYFSSVTYGNIDKAKIAALNYRDTTLENWLKSSKP